MSKVLPILFNTDMVRAILDGRKTVTRRVIKVPVYYPNFYKLHNNSDGAITCSRDALCAGFYKDSQVFYIDGKKHIDAVYYKAPCKPGDILYVREAYSPDYFDSGLAGYRGDGLRGNRNAYKADYRKEVVGDVVPEPKWRPSIHMPKEAARIWLKVTDVRVERLQDITEEQALKEGASNEPLIEGGENFPALYDFIGIWNSTIERPDLDRYGWEANPYVWVIEFERCEKPRD